MKKRIVSLLLALAMIVTSLPLTVFAAHDSTGKPLDLNGQVYLALYVGGGDTFPGEPAEHDVSGYLNLNSNFQGQDFSIYASNANGILKEQILDDVVQGTSGVWGVFSTTGGSRYLDPASGIVDADGTHNASVEEKIINTAIANNKFKLGDGETVSDYTIIWYVIKYQRSDSAWHIDGVITKKTTYSVNYYGNGNTSGAAPTGVSGIEPGSMYTVEGNTGNLQRKVGNDTYLFDGWNTAVDGTGTHYEPGEQIEVNSNITLYAQWYLQNKYTITVVSKLDDNETNVSDIHGEELTFWVKEKDSEDYLELTRTTTGTYTTTVTENGEYQVYSRKADGTFQEAHGHKVIIYNQNGRTELLNYSVTYDANADGDTVTWTEGEAPKQQNYHATESMFATTNKPVREGYIFVCWQDQNGNTIFPDRLITYGITEKTVLKAVWQKNVDVTVNIIVNHKAEGAINPDKDKGKILFNLLEQVGDVDLPVDSVGVDQLLGSESTDWNYAYNGETGISTYTYTFKNLPQGVYTAAATKSHYETTVTRSGESFEDQTIDIELNYAPQTFDLDFQVQVNFTEETKALMPAAVNVRVLYWTGTEWALIGQHGEGTAPVSVFIDENGKGQDYFPVWKTWDTGEPYSYRVAVSSFVMPDGTVIPAFGNDVLYTPDGSGLYKATVEVKDGVLPTYPSDDTTLTGAEYGQTSDNEQVGLPVVTVDITPFTVTFVTDEGTVEGETTLVLSNQYQYPNLKKYVPEVTDHNHYFAGWYTADGKPAENKLGQYLTEDVVYYAKFQHGMIVEGTVTVEATYEQDGKVVTVNASDRAQEVLVVLDKMVGDNLVAVSSQIVPITYDTNGTGTYRFQEVPNDGTGYRVKVLVKNYDTTYDNESDPEVSYTETEYTAVLGDDEVAVVDALLDFNPEKYIQHMEVDASRIGEGFRPAGVQAVLLGRDRGDIHPYRVITQHTVEPYGVYIPLSAAGSGHGSYEVWKYHTDSTLYEYQMDITHAMGNVDGVFTENGAEYNSDTAPFTIEYGPSSEFSTATAGQLRTLTATLIPKEYKITFDLGIGEGEQVEGMDQYLTDSETGESYIYHHTWSKSAEFDAYPYRPGYVFTGWECENEGVMITKGGHVYVAPALAEDIVLKAKWDQVQTPAYVVRHLEMNTDAPLKGAVVVENVAVGSVVKAVDAVAEIKGYKFAGVMLGGKVYSVEENAQMTVTENTEENVMIIYYLPDGSDGYTEQVESNLKLDKTAVLEDNGTYTITMETFTKDNPITTLIQQNTPLDIVLVLDQSGSLADNSKAGLTALQGAVDTFVKSIADHGRHNEVDHRIALVGYASNETDGTSSTDASTHPYSGGVVSSRWTNTGVFDSNGKFHLYDVTGFNYTQYTGSVEKDGIYYTQSAEHKNAFLLLTYHEEYRHLITEEEARLAVLDGTKVYGYVYDEYDVGSFVELTRNTSGLWLYGDKQLYSQPEFFTYHTDVWTHRHGLEKREIHAYGTGSNYKEADGHTGVYTRTETTGTSYQLGVYEDALIPVSVGANGSGGVNPGLIKSTQGLGANGGTRASYGMEMANAIFAANPAEDRVRIVVMFTDGQPGQSGFLESEANAAIAEAYETKQTHGAYVYTIGLYASDGVDADSDIAYYMNALSSNYPNAKSMADIKSAATYVPATEGKALNDGITRYVLYNGTYYTLKYGRVWANYSYSNCWYFTTGSGWGSNNIRVSTNAAPVITNGKVGSYPIYEYKPAGYAETENAGYYSTTDSTTHLEEYFMGVMQEITTKITREIVLHEDTILRDIMGQGLVLRPGSVITAYKVPGTYNAETKEVDWEESRTKVAQVTVPENVTGTVLASPETTTIDYYQADGSVIQEENVPYITVYNLTAENATDPNAPDYHPHAVDITGYDFDNWYISEEKPEGFKLVVEITNIEATDDVQWGRSTPTNHPESGLWLPKDANGNRQLLLPFDQPTTIFVERAYVLDYGKQFTLSGWYFDDEGEKAATPIHLDCDVENGMNKFDTANKQNGKNNPYGNTKYGNVQVKDDGTVTYTPTSMSWGGYDQFMIFGDTWRKTVLAQDANENGNLWNKVTVIPANNIYYEDSFITTPSDQQNGMEGFVFSDQWGIVTDGEVGKNQEVPEHLESAPYGDVHGWTDALADDNKFTDGSAHFVGGNGDADRGAWAEFTFTGTGVDVYTRTNMASGLVVAMLTSQSVDENGNPVTKVVKSLAMDNKAASGDYYHIPTVSFDNLVYGTYTLKLVATSVKDADTGMKRYEYYIDGARVYNPLGMTQNYASEIIKDAYGKENNAVYTEVRDILLQQGDFNPNLSDEEGGKQGAVFIDQVKEGQQAGDEPTGNGTYTYALGVFKEYGPKNEVYLSAGQAIVLKVTEGNTYYVGLKSLTGDTVKVNVSGITKAQPTTIEISHTTDMYYQVTPVDGYIVLQNGGQSGILSITNLRTTNPEGPVEGGGVITIEPVRMLRFMRSFSQRLEEQNNIDTQPGDQTDEILDPSQQQVKVLFESVRTWLKEEEQ